MSAVAFEDKVTFATFLPNAAALKFAVILWSEFFVIVGVLEKCGFAARTGDMINIETRKIRSVMESATVGIWEIIIRIWNLPSIKINANGLHSISSALLQENKK